MGILIIFLIVFYGITLPICFIVNWDLAKTSRRWRPFAIALSFSIPIVLELILTISTLDDIDWDWEYFFSRNYWDNSSVHLIFYGVMWAVISGLTAAFAQWWGLRDTSDEA